MASSQDNTVYVVTGGNRGIGLGLVKSLLSRPSTTVVATVRNDEAASSLKSEATIPIGSDSRLYIIQLDFTTAVAPDAIRQAFETTGVDHIDVLINNAAQPLPMTPAASTTAEHLRASFETNTIAPLLVFQGLWPLLQRATAGPPRCIMVTSSVGCITQQEAPGGAYGPSKAALNWLTRALHLQNEPSGLVAVALHPGWVQTRAGEFAAREWGFPGVPPVTVEDCVQGMLKVIDEATRDKYGGQFVYQGHVLPW